MAMRGKIMREGMGLLRQRVALLAAALVTAVAVSACGDGDAKPDIARPRLENGQIVFRYCTEDGRVVKEANPNGSLDNIAGVVNETGTVLGLMPHPERAAEAVLGGTDGVLIFNSLLGSLVEDGSFSKR